MSISDSKSVQFSGRTLTVFAVPNTLRVTLRQTELRANEIARLGEREVGGLERFYYTEIYPALAVCTKSDDDLPIPSSDDLFDCTDINQSNDWYMAAVELNEHLFPTRNEEEPTEEKAEEVKKKRRHSRRTIQPTA